MKQYAYIYISPISGDICCRVDSFLSSSELNQPSSGFDVEEYKKNIFNFESISNFWFSYDNKVTVKRRYY